MRHTYWFFPGDPPIFDVLLIIGSLIGALSLLIVLGSRAFRSRIRLVLLRVGITVAILSVAMVVPGAIVVGYRQTSAWAPLRSAIRHYDDLIWTEVRERGSQLPLSPQEFETLRSRFIPEPVAISLADGAWTVHLRMAHGIPPYVGVDFGDGASALFDPRTMLCIYSD